MPDKTLFITGIGTGIGKTIVSAVLTEKLKSDYWKPIQSGDLDDSDTLKVKNLVSNTGLDARLVPFIQPKSAKAKGVKLSTPVVASGS